MTGLVRFSVLTGLVGGLALAAPQTTTTTNTTTTATPSSNSSTATVSAPSDEKVFGTFEVRPSWASRNGNVDTENTLEAGYQFNKTTKLSYAQFFKTDLFPATSLQGKGVHLRGDGGFARVKVAEIYKSEDKLTTLAFQGRIYSPTDDSMAGTGFLTAAYGSFKLQHDFGILKADISEAPVAWFFSKNGNAGEANPYFQNRVVLNVDIKILKNLTFSLPLIMDAYRNRNFAGAKNSDKWEANFWIWPELDLDLNDTHTVGIAYRSKNLVASSLTTTDLSNAFQKGILQLLWTVNL